MSTVVVSGFFTGLIYGLLGVGLVVVYRGARVISFAYAETGMIGAMAFAELWADNGVPLVVALGAGVAISAAVGAATERLVIRPLRDAPRLTVMVATFGVASILLVFATRRYGLNPRFIDPLVGGVGPRVAGVTIQPGQLLVLVATVAVMVGLWALYRFTSFGLRLRAVALDPYGAGLSGIDIDRVSVLTWALAGAIAGLSAILIAPLVAFHVYFMTGLVIRGLAAALVGGLTSVSGALATGVFLGVAEAIVGFKAPITGIVEASVAVLIIVLLLLRPQGLARSVY